MSQAAILAWTVPVVLVALGGMFLAVHAKTRTTLWWAVGYALLAAAFGVELLFAGTTIGVLGVSALFILSLAVCQRAVAVRYGAPTQDWLLSGFCILAIGLNSYLLLVHHSTLAVLTVTHLACAGLQAAAAAQMVGRMRHQIDIAIFALLLLMSINLVARIGAFHWYAAGGDALENWRESGFAFAFSMTSALFALAFAITVLVATGIDLIEKHRADTMIDPLSGILNRKGFHEHAERVISSLKPGQHAAVILADIDHFKGINDQFGHLAGDRVITRFASILQEVVGQEGIVSRIGGDEFAILRQANGHKTPTEIADSIRVNFARATEGEGTAIFRTTASFGVALLRRGDRLEDALEAADAGLYRAKSAGRNRISRGSPLRAA